MSVSNLAIVQSLSSSFCVHLSMFISVVWANVVTVEWHANQRCADLEILRSCSQGSIRICKTKLSGICVRTANNSDNVQNRLDPRASLNQCSM